MEESKKKTSGKKKLTSVVAVLLALVIALGGTFAWQSISQQSLNEAETYKNPGGRLHDDFSGWYITPQNEGYLTKDIYVENYGTQNIYARIRLDEFMEIGTGAGLKSGEEGAADKDVWILNYTTGASIDDVTKWDTHIPGDPTVTGESIANGDGNEDFHDYWTWILGSEDEDNPDGTTVYMPTFNKNNDSLAADINGTMDGSNATDTVQYDDFVKYIEYVPAVYDTDGTTVLTAASGDSADRVRNEDKDDLGGYIIPSGAFYDADTNTDSEGSVSDPTNGMYGNGGANGTNYSVIEETHYATKTLKTGAPMTMDAWLKWADGKSEKQLADGACWVYDTDGWAYWSQPIAPGTATGLLLDKIEPTSELLNLAEDWYYGINAVAQFITADSLGRTSKTGFYDANAGKAPTTEALQMLDLIGVNVTMGGTITAVYDPGYDNVVMGYIPSDKLGSSTYELQLTATFDGITDYNNVEWVVYDGEGNKLVADTDYEISDNAKGQIVTLGLLKDGAVAKGDVETVHITASDPTQNLSATLDLPVTKEADYVKSIYGTAQTVSFGGIEWYVVGLDDSGVYVDEDQNKHEVAVLMSKYVLDTMAYNTDGSVQPIANSTLGKWLNADDGFLVGDGDALNTSNVMWDASIMYSDEYVPENVGLQLTLPSAMDIYGEDYIDGTKVVLSEAYEEVYKDMLRETGSSIEATQYADEIMHVASMTGVMLKAPGGTWAATTKDAPTVNVPWWIQSTNAAGNQMAFVADDGNVGYASASKTYGVRPVFFYDLGVMGEKHVMSLVESGGTDPLKNTTKTVTQGETLTLQAAITTDGTNPFTGTNGKWTWDTTGAPDEIIVTQDGTDGSKASVFVAYSARVDNSDYIIATYTYTDTNGIEQSQNVAMKIKVTAGETYSIKASSLSGANFDSGLITTGVYTGDGTLNNLNLFFKIVDSTDGDADTTLNGTWHVQSYTDAGLIASRAASFQNVAFGSIPAQLDIAASADYQTGDTTTIIVEYLVDNNGVTGDGTGDAGSEDDNEYPLITYTITVGGLMAATP